MRSLKKKKKSEYIIIIIIIIIYTRIHNAVRNIFLKKKHIHTRLRNNNFE